MRDYDEMQLNQITKGYEEGNKLIKEMNSNVSVHSLRAFRNIYKKLSEKISDNILEKFVELANDGFGLYKITDQMIDNNISLLLKIIKECPEYLEEFYDEAMNDKKRDYILTNIKTKNLLRYKKYKLDELCFLLTHNITDLEENIEKNNYNLEQLTYIASLKKQNILCEELMSDKYSRPKMELILYLVENNLDYKIVDKYSDEQVYRYLSLIEIDSDISKFYKENYPEDILRFMYNCFNVHKDPYEYVSLALKLNVGLRECLLELCEANVTKNTIKAFLDNTEKLSNTRNLIHIVRYLENANSYFYRSKESEDLSYLFKEDYSLEQLDVLLDSLRKGINLGLLCSPEYSIDKMKFIAQCVKYEIDVSTILNPEYSVEDMRRVSFYNNKGIFFDTLEEYYENYTRDKNNDYKTFVQLTNQMSDTRIDNSTYMIVDALVKYNLQHEHQINIEQIIESQAYFNVESFFKDLANGLDVNLIWNAKYNKSQQQQIREGLLSGVDITQYNDPNNSAEIMKQKREELEEKLSLSDKIDALKNTNKTTEIKEDKER